MTKTALSLSLWRYSGPLVSLALHERVTSYKCSKTVLFQDSRYYVPKSSDEADYSCLVAQGHDLLRMDFQLQFCQSCKRPPLSAQQKQQMAFWPCAGAKANGEWFFVILWRFDRDFSHLFFVLETGAPWRVVLCHVLELRRPGGCGDNYHEASPFVVFFFSAYLSDQFI